MNLENLRLRPSMGPIAKNCPSSMWQASGLPEIHERSSIFSATGSALHAVFSDIIYKGGELSNEALGPYCDKFNVDLEGFFGIGWRSKKIAEKWSKVSSWFDGAEREKTISCTLANGFVLSGTPDLFRVYGEFATIFDLKTGEQEVDYFPQLELYALILWKNFGATGLVKFNMAVFAPMQEKFEARTITAEYLEELEQKYVEAMHNAGVIYSPGPWCRFCKRLTNCPTMIQAIDPTSLMVQDSTRELTGADIGRARPIIALMQKVIERYKELEKNLLEQQGVIDMRNGYELAFSVIAHKKFHTIETIAYLQKEGMSLDGIHSVMEITSENVKEACREISVERSKEKGIGITQRRIMANLEAIKAYEETSVKRIVQRPVRNLAPPTPGDEHA